MRLRLRYTLILYVHIYTIKQCIANIIDEGTKICSIQVAVIGVQNLNLQVQVRPIQESVAIGFIDAKL